MDRLAEGAGHAMIARRVPLPALRSLAMLRLPLRSRSARAAFLIGGLLVLAALVLMRVVPQRPDGDATAVALFASRYAPSPLYEVRGALWYRIGLALLAWGALDGLLGRDAPLASWLARWAMRAVWLGVIVGSIGLMAQSLRGWQGDLFLEPAVAVHVACAHPFRVTFDGFRLTPAASGPGRDLPMLVTLQGVGPHRPVAISVREPFQNGDVGLTPKWFGVTVTGSALAQPLFFGASGTQGVALRDGGSARVTVDLDSLAISSEPPVAGLRAHHHAILAARCAPGAWLRGVAGALILGGLVVVALDRLAARRS